MKAKFIIVMLLCTIWGIGMNAQTRDDIYFICISTSEEQHSGRAILRGSWIDDSVNTPLCEHSPIFVSMSIFISGNEITARLKHLCFNLEELKKIRIPDEEDHMEVVVKPKSFYTDTILKATLPPVDLNKKIETFNNKEELYAWADSYKGKRVYLLDWSDPMNKEAKGDGSTIRLLEVRVSRPVGY